MVVIYLGSVVLLQRVARFLGVTNDSPLTVMVSTLGIAALFQPLRRWIQAAVDRRFYRRKYNASRLLQTFGAKVRDEVELHHLADDLVGVVDQALQPAHLSLWMRPLPRVRQPVDEQTGLESE